jgi:predicted phosphodiesterase
MRYGIFADIHSNLEAFEAVTEAYQREMIDAFFCVGDIVGYGANPSECVKCIKKIKACCIAGNHDWAAVEKISMGKFNDDAKEAMRWTSTQLNENEKEFLKSLELVNREDDFIFVHGTLHCPEEFNYLIDFSQMVHTLALMDRPICFVGHSHVPRFFVEGEDGKVKEQHEFVVNLQVKNRYIVNVGSVGQPRDGNPKASYCIFDLEKRTIEIKRVAYDIKKAQDKILKAGLPVKLASRLALGR